MKLKLKITVSIFALFIVIIITKSITSNNINIDDEKIPSGTTEVLAVETGFHDDTVIPDKYNTGSDESILSIVNGPGIYDGVKFSSSSNDTKLSLDLYYNNMSLPSVIDIKNKDFSQLPLIFLNDSAVKEKKTVIFTNCSFDSITSGRTDSLVNYVFNNCTIRTFYGSNATFEGCYFGGGNSDGLNPLRNVILNNCYIADLSHKLDAGIINRVLHSDGTQIFGYEGVDVYNIHYNNVRFEVPEFPYTANHTNGNSVYVNSCIAVALEKSSASNLSFSNIIMNGGGFSIYAFSKNDKYILDDISFSNIQIGSSHRWGPEYQNNSIDINYSKTEKLYVGSVWKDDSGNIHISVTNDTNTERTLIVTTELGNSKYIVSKSPEYSDFNDETEFSNLPIDLDYKIGKFDWIVCYDGEAIPENQIRFKNWGSQSVYIPNTNRDNALDTFGASNSVTSTDTINKSIMNGACGKNITFTLTDNGTLTLNGTGETFDYNSTKLPPWYDIKDSIKTIVVNDGITVIGTQLFRKCSNASQILLPDSLTIIESNAFINCSSVTEIRIPTSLITVGSFAFHGTGINTVYYNSRLAWNSLSIGSNNEPILNASKIITTRNDYTNSANNEPINSLGIVSQGNNCGRNISWVLYDNGQLVLEGTGGTYNYNSSKLPPWEGLQDQIRSVFIGDGITLLGSQLFRNCKNIESLDLPSGITGIGDNAFIGCSSLTTLYFSNSILSIGKYATWNTNLTDIYYSGTETEWSSILVGTNNNKLMAATIHFR